MGDVDAVRSFFDQGGLVAISALAVWVAYKLAIYMMERERQNAADHREDKQMLSGLLERTITALTRLEMSVSELRSDIARTFEQRGKDE